jgi:hypothetical protein
VAACTIHNGLPRQSRSAAKASGTTALIPSPSPSGCAIESKRDAIDKTARDEKARWQNEKEKLAAGRLALRSERVAGECVGTKVCSDVLDPVFFEIGEVR